MVNPKDAGGGAGGEGNRNGGDKGKGKMVMEDKGKGKMIKTSKDDDNDILVRTYGKLAELLHKQMLEVKAWKERSNTVKEGKEEEGQECPEWDDPLALQLEELVIHNLRDFFRRAIKKIAENGCTTEQAEWAVLTSGFYIGNNDDITSNIVAAAMALLSNYKKKEFDPSERYIFESVENLANYSLVEMVNVLKQVNPHLTVADAMWLLLLFSLNLIQAAWETQSVDPKGSPSSSSSSSSSRNVVPENAVQEKVPKSEKDEAIKALMQRKKDVESELQGWSDWTSKRVGQAAQKLRRNQEEMKKKISELDLQLSKVKAQMKTETATLRKLQAKHTMLQRKLEDSKLLLSQYQNLQEIQLREQELLKQITKLEAEVKFSQKDLARLKAESAKLSSQHIQQIDKARKRENEIEVVLQREEREKLKLLQELETLRKERQEMEEKARMEEEKLKAKAEENQVKYEESMKELRAQISAFKIGESSSSGSGQEAKKRERECVMCLNADKTVLFLPCAHMALCQECNEFHQSQEMNDCPICRTSIEKRIHVRFLPPNPAA